MWGLDAIMFQANVLTESHPINPTPDAGHSRLRLRQLTLLALGVVYGDIGTSPLYALKECFRPEHNIAPDTVNVYGVLSLMVWSLFLIVTVKYITFVLRADNRGEGGTFALLALILQQQRRAGDERRRLVIISLAIVGAALLYGDGVITPAISVLGAVEGLEVIAPQLERLVVPITVVLLFGLFMLQRKGTAHIGRLFGPIMTVWFVTIGAFGLMSIVRHPEVLLSVNPWYAVEFFIHHGTYAFTILGSVVLAVTGAEALYADMGHFGRKPIRYAWLGLVFPALLLNYFGQGALLIQDASAISNPFYLLAPRMLLYPYLILATMAAIIAAQAVISGSFSLTQQAVQLGYSPRLLITHTSRHERGQIFIPEVNNALMIGTLLIVIGFKSADKLGAAYGIAVTGTMTITTLLFYVLVRHRWHWSRWRAIPIVLVFLIIDLSFLGANLLKIREGGWVPVAIAIGVFILMTTWNRGRTTVLRLLKRSTIPLDTFLEDIARRKPNRVPGTAVFMTSASEGAPLVLLHHLKHNKILHEQVVLFSVSVQEIPEVAAEDRVELTRLSEGFFRVTATYGFMEQPDVPAVLQSCASQGLVAKPLETTYYLGRERLIPTGRTRMFRWRKQIYIFMSRNSRSATEFFGIPPNRVVELGAQVEF
jgi:KUP system potassium uptake protein